MTRIFTLSVALWTSAAAIAGAAPIVFDNEAEFIAATAPQAFVDFNDATPVNFAGGSASHGNMSFSGPLHPTLPDVPFLVNYIGGVPDVKSVDTTRAVHGYTTRDASMRIDFLAPVTSWGASFNDLGDQDRVTRLTFLNAFDAIVGEIIVSGLDDLETSFWGIDLGGVEASALEFNPIVLVDDAEAWVMDNVHYSTGRVIQPAPVPLPVE